MARRSLGAAPARVLDVAGAAAGLLVSLAVYAPRLPAGGDLITPNLPGSGLLLALARAFANPSVAAALSWAAIGAVASSAAALGWSVWTRARSQPAALKALSTAKAAARAVGAVIGCVAFAALARFSLAAWLDVLGNAWFMPEALDLREPLLMALLFAGAFVLALRAASAFASWAVLAPTRAGARSWSVPAAVLLAAGLSGLVLSRGLYDGGAPDLGAALGEKEADGALSLVAVLSDDQGGPVSRVVSVESDPGISGVEGFLDKRGRTVYARAALRRLYSGCTIAMDAGCLRRVLLRGVHAGDPYARLLLLDHLASAASGADARAALGELADEKRFRVGARAAARLALAWSRQGEGEAAKTWLARSAQGPGALPPGLVELPEKGGPLKGGRIAGRVRASGAARVALYVRAHPRQPSLLGPAQLAASAVVGRDGRFRFDGLSAGDYYLAVAVEPARPTEAARLRVLGRKGDLTLSAKRPAIDGLSLELRD